MSERIRVEIDAEGNPTVSVNGVKGGSCEQLTRDIERALGKASNHKRTGEYFEQEVQSVSRKERA